MEANRPSQPGVTAVSSIDCGYGTHATWPRIHIIGAYQPLNQALTALLETTFNARCTVDNLCPQKQGERHSTVHLIDCMTCDWPAAKNWIRRQLDAAFSGMKIVLFNADAVKDLGEFIDQYPVQGIFLLDDSRSAFIVGMRTILDGGTRLEPHAPTPAVMKDRIGDTTATEKGAIPLSRRESEILDCIADGMDNHSIAEKYEISLHTVKTHVYNIFKKIDVPNRLQASRWVRENKARLN